MVVAEGAQLVGGEHRAQPGVALHAGGAPQDGAAGLVRDAGDFLVAFAEQVAELAQVVGVAFAAEQDLDRGEVADDGVALVASVGLAGLPERLEGDDGADPGAAAGRQQLVDGVQRGGVGGLVEGDEQRRVEPGAGPGGAAGGRGDGGDQCDGEAADGALFVGVTEDVDRVGAGGDEVGRVEAFAGAQRRRTGRGWPC